MQPRPAASRAAGQEIHVVRPESRESMEQRSARIRWLVLLVVAVLWMGAIFLRLSYLQLIRYGDYFARARRQQQRIIEVSPKRGVIYDRNGRELAMSISVDSCFADPSEISDHPMVARLISRVIGLPPDVIQRRLAETDSRYFAWVARKIPPEMVERIQALNLKGIYFQKENKRFYPQQSLAAHVLGYVDVDEHGQAGIEYSLDQRIRGRPGLMLVLADARHRLFDSGSTNADSGSSVVLTLDENIQFIAEKELAAGIAQSHAKAGVVVVQDPNTGEILALANWPAFNPNNHGDASDDQLMDRAVGAAYEPGSTFKLITLAGAIAERITRPSEVVDCQMGSIVVAGRLIHDWHPFGLLTVADVLAHSSDVGAIKIGLRLGAPRFYRCIRAFGFGQPTGIELPGENRGLLRRPENWTASSIGSLAMGQEISATPVQMITAVSSIANGGLLCHPHIVREIRRGASVEPARVPDPRRALDATAAATLRQMMEGVVLEGTGRQAALNGYSVAGKTGTAQKIDPATGRYSATQYVASFIGFAPVNSPAVTILVAFDSPVGAHHGGDVAGPVFRRIAEQVLAYLDVPRDLPVTPEVKWAALHKNEAAVSEGVSEVQPESAEPVAAAAALPAASTATAPTVALGDGKVVTVPQFAGQTVRDVTETCLHLGLTPVLVGSGIAVEQLPPPGTQVSRASRVTVRFARRAAVVPASAGENDR